MKTGLRAPEPLDNLPCVNCTTHCIALHLGYVPFAIDDHWEKPLHFLDYLVRPGEVKKPFCSPRMNTDIDVT